MKKLLTLLLCLIVGIGSMSAERGQYRQSGTFSNGGTWEIVSGILTIDADVIPDAPNTRPSARVDLIGEPCNVWENMSPWWGASKYITEVRLSSRVYKIGKYAFAGLTSLRRVVIDNNNRTYNIEIGEEAFSECWRLESFDFSRVQIIHPRAFQYCYYLGKKIELPVLQTVGEDAFAYCASLWDKDGGIILSGNTRVSGLANIIAIQTGRITKLAMLSNEKEEYVPVIDNLSGYLKVIVPPSLLSSYQREYRDHLGFISLYVGDGDWYYDSDSYKLYIGGKYYSGIPDFASESERPWNAVKDDAWYIYLTLQAYGAKIGSNAFKGFSKLQSVEFESFMNDLSIEENAFAQCPKLWSFPFEKVTKIGPNAFNGADLCGAQTWVVRSMPNVKNIGKGAFANSQIRKVGFGSNLQSIGSEAFKNSALTNILVQGNAPTTAQNAFSGVSDVTLGVPATYASSYNIVPWKNFTQQIQVEYPVSGTWGIGYGQWQLTDDGTLTITKTSSSGFDSSIPDYAKVSDQPWYAYRSFIRKIVLSDQILGIGKNAFAFAQAGESNLQSIEAPAVTSIKANAFKNNGVLRSFTGENLQTIGDSAFIECVNLEEVHFGDNVSNIGNYAFSGCAKIYNFILETLVPPTVTAQTFVGMGATSANAPGRNGAKASATGQKSVSLEVPESAVVTYANTLYWNLFSMDYIGEHGAIVAGDVFGNGMWVLYADSTLMVSCSSLETGSGIQDQNSVHDWGTNASKIKRIEVLGELPELYRSFNNLPNLESVSFSSSVKKLYSTFRNCPKLKDIPLNDVEEFREYGNLGCFEKCNALTEVKLQSARIIGYRCFAECANLKTVEFPNADTIANVAFVSCPKLESVTVNNAYIGNAFRGCTGLKEVTLNGVKGHVLTAEAFDGCTSLKTVRMYGSLHKVENDAFDGCTALTDIYLSSPYPADVANKYNSNVFRGVTLSQVNLHVPSDFVTRYSSSYNNPIWSQMNVVADTDFSEPMIPTGGALGSYGTWELGTNQKLFINCSDSMPTAQSAFGQDSYADTWYDWMPYVSTIEFSKTTKAVSANAFGLYLADNNFAKVGTITLGAGMQYIGERGLFLKFQNSSDVYCYAEEPPFLDGNNCFNWSEISSANVTLHVLTKSGVRAKYAAANGWKDFPNIVADLGPRYKVSWEAHNGGIKVQESGIDLNSVPAGTTIHLVASPYYGYRLKKWINYNPTTGLTVNSDVTVGAEFTTDYIVSFKKIVDSDELFQGWGWQEIKRDTVEEGQAATAPADPTREGYRFTGWSCSFDSVVKNLDVYARYEKLVYAEGIEVTPKAKSYQVSSSELGTKTLQYYATVLPGNVDNDAVTWSSSDEEVATVDANGLVTVQDFGSAYIIATAADGSNVSGQSLLGIFDADWEEPVYGTAIAVEGGVTEITMTKSQSAKLVNLVVTPENYNGGISAMHGPLRVNPCGEGEKTLPAFYIQPEMGVTCPYTDTVVFMMNSVDPHGSHIMPRCTLVVKVTEDIIFTAKTIEGVDMTFRVTDPEAMTCEVYGYMEQLMEPDPVTHEPFIMHPAVDASTAGKITVPAVAKGCTVTHLSQQAFAGCSGLTEIELENGIQYIKMGAFQECSALQKLILPKSIKGLSMLGGMPQLANVYMYNPEPPIGWEIAENGENMMPDIAMTNAFQMIAANATLHVARGCRPAYNKTPWTTWFATITDDVDAAFKVRFVDWDDSEIEIQTVDYCAAASPSQTPSREGHTFTGWDKDFSRVVANMTVKAQYEAMTYSVTFLNWDGTQLGATQTVTYGHAAVAPSVPARSGYVFAGWNADFSKVTRDMTVKAMFSKEGQYLVTFVDWDDSTLKCEIVDAGGDATAPEDPVREGYVFTGWSGSYTNVHADLIIQALYNESTGIEEIFSQPDAPKALKVLIDGQIYILRNDGAIFDVRGVRVK